MEKEPAIEKHQADEVSALQSALQALTPQVCASMMGRVHCRLATDDAIIPLGCKLIHFIRHGEGHHNVVQREWRAMPDWDGVSEPYTIDNDPDYKFLDPELTAKGWHHIA